MNTMSKLVLMAAAGWAGIAAAADSLCASVKIEIEQELTLERQAFDAKMRINNGLDAVDLTDVSVTLSVTDAAGQPVPFTSNTQATNALFYVQAPVLVGIDSSGTVAAKTSADLDWLIIPTPGAAGGGTGDTE